MKIKQKKRLTKLEKKQVKELWNQEYPKSIQHRNLKSFEGYLKGLRDKNHKLVLNELGEIKGWYIDFIRDEQRNFAIILHEDIQGKGYGDQLLKAAQCEYNELNAWVVDTNTQKKSDGSFYLSPLAFYQKRNFDSFPAIRFDSDVLSSIKIKWTRKKT